MTRTPPVLRLVRELPASPEEVFDAWTDPLSIRVWMCPGRVEESVAALDVRVGGRFRIVMREVGTEHVHTGEYVEVDQRGLDMWNGAYHLLDLTPKGRDEAGLPHSMAWVRHRDKYDAEPIRMTLRK